MKIGEWFPTAEIRNIRRGTVAELRVKGGRVVLATWRYSGRVCAWYLEPGQQHKHGIGLYDPEAIRILAVGHSLDDGTSEGWRREALRLGRPT